MSRRSLALCSAPVFVCRYSPDEVVADGSGALLSNSWLLQPASLCHHTPPPQPCHWTHSSVSPPPSNVPVSQDCQRVYRRSYTAYTFLCLGLLKRSAETNHLVFVVVFSPNDSFLSR